jgi:diguanylate cyclase (GGDEF)-like protein
MSTPAQANPSTQSENTDAIMIERLFMQSLLKNIGSGVIYVDSHNVVLFWNATMEQLTGMRASTLFGKRWGPTKLGLSHRDNGPMDNQQCPAKEAMQTGEIVRFNGSIVGKGARHIEVSFQAIPVCDHHGDVYGAVMIVDDTTRQNDLKKQMEAWHARATLDPLTQIANRAELERTLEFLVRKNREKPVSCSIIICDIDFFKKINDDYGHHVGDLALISFARNIQEFTRAEDLLARYGGEEFVLICVNCDLDLAVNRAEEIRAALEQTPQPHLEGKCIRASFGVAELSQDDNATDFFVRADRALMTAKESGRNLVVKSVLNPATKTIEYEPVGAEKTQIERNLPGDILIDESLSTPVTVDVIIAKLKGFVSDQKAAILEVESNHIRIQIQDVEVQEGRRSSDRETPMLIDLFVTDLEPSNRGRSSNVELRSGLRTIIRPARSRDRRLSELQFIADKVKTELYSYLMISSAENQAKILPAATESGRVEP